MKTLQDKQDELEEKILHLIDNQDEYTRSDLQGIVTWIVMDALRFKDGE
jgi:hypothetical protein